MGSSIKGNGELLLSLDAHSQGFLGGQHLVYDDDGRGYPSLIRREFLFLRSGGRRLKELVKCNCDYTQRKASLPRPRNKRKPSTRC